MLSAPDSKDARGLPNECESPLKQLIYRNKGDLARMLRVAQDNSFERSERIDVNAIPYTAILKRLWLCCRS